MIKQNPLETINGHLFTIMAHLIIFKTITKFLFDLYRFCYANLGGFILNIASQSKPNALGWL